MVKKNTSGELDIIFSSIPTAWHILHLYSPSVDKYDIHKSFMANGGGSAAYVTSEDPDYIAKQFEGLKTKVVAIDPKNMNDIAAYKKVVIDAGSFNTSSPPAQKNIRSRKRLGEEILTDNYSDHLQRENCLSKNKDKQSILCTYDISKLNSKKIKNLAACHDKLILSTNNETLLSSNTLTKEELSNETVEQFVKNDLETIVLALLMRKARCGRDIKEEIYKNFNVLLSSGTLYPLLHKLSRDGLLACKAGIKTKKYTPLNREKIQQILNEHIQTKQFLNKFLQTVGSVGGK